MPNERLGREIILTRLLIVLQIFILACTNQENAYNGANEFILSDTSEFVIKAGEVKGLRINKSKIQDAFNIFGDNDEFDQSLACGEAIAYHKNRFMFFKHNMVVMSNTIEGSDIEKDLAKSEISNLGILYPAKAVTEKGIKLKTDNLDKIIKIYGKEEGKVIMKNNIYLHYYSQGISFDCDRADKSIERIEVYKKGGIPDFWYWRK